MAVISSNDDLQFSAGESCKILIILYCYFKLIKLGHFIDLISDYKPWKRTNIFDAYWGILFLKK